VSAERPAVLGGEPAFPDGLPLVRPTPVADPAALRSRLEAVLASGKLTNGAVVEEFEATAAARLGVAHAVAVSSCTSGLMLVLQGLGATGRVVLPSFTFAASGHAVRWAGGTPVWAEVDPRRCTVDPADVESIVPGAAAMTATHVFGAPCQVEELQRIADGEGIPLVYDAAHALGSSRGGRPIGGFGAAEVFSLSPTKVVFAGEGGLVTTNDRALAEHVRLGRDYGNPGDYNCRFPGLNARMSEVHAAIGLASLDGADKRIAHRNDLVREFRAVTAEVSGVSFQHVDEGDVSTYKDLTLLVDASAAGLDTLELAAALRAEGIDTRRYYAPPLHQQQAYSDLPVERELPVTDVVAAQVLTVPLWSHMTFDEVRTLGAAVSAAFANADQVRSAVRAAAP
jgi:dTDP-4-amino-4,6-dideoxygalactose transaminase